MIALSVKVYGLIIELLDLGAIPNFKNATSLMGIACCANSRELLERLIDLGANPDLHIEAFGMKRPLELATNLGIDDHRIMKTLTDLGADASFLVEDGTVLLTACKDERFLRAQYLLSIGCKVSFSSVICMLTYE